MIQLPINYPKSTYYQIQFWLDMHSFNLAFHPKIAQLPIKLQEINPMCLVYQIPLTFQTILFFLLRIFQSSKLYPDIIVTLDLSHLSCNNINTLTCQNFTYINPSLDTAVRNLQVFPLAPFKDSVIISIQSHPLQNVSDKYQSTFLFSFSRFDQ